MSRVYGDRKRRNVGQDEELEEEASEEVLSERFLAEVAKRPQYGVMPKIRPWEEARFNQAVADRIARVNQKWGFPVRKRSR